MSLIYLVSLLVSLFGLAVLDRRFGLAFWRAPARTAVLLLVGVLGFLAWDLAGIGLGIFFRGPSRLMTGLVIAPELPVEEVLFLTLLCYVSLLAYLAASRWRERRNG